MFTTLTAAIEMVASSMGEEKGLHLWEKSPFAWLDKNNCFGTIAVGALLYDGLGNNLGVANVYPEHRHYRSLGLQPEHCLKLTLEELPTWV